ncbi:unnamed protein product [[Candida] boidinii]|nr:unnamed protein product [[Candida] boidinii]
MGGSGAGKTTLLDILAGKNKSGIKSGDFYVNGEKISTKSDLQHFQKSIGFVDQEDYLIPTLTVYETVLNSALLRLPRSMSNEVKKGKVLQILSELRILHIKDKLIGSDFERGISGGEKRRVAIACELVTSPSILFLDEPTSGLDSFNAYNVVECLVRLAQDFRRTIIFTIHQPRSNIVALFDKLLLLSDGEIIYSGSMLECNNFFYSKGYKCPNGYNLADYLIDITSGDTHLLNTNSVNTNSGRVDDNNNDDDENHEDEHVHDIPSGNNIAEDPTSEWAHFAVHRDEYSHILNKSKDNKNGKISDKKTNSIYKIYQNSVLAEQEHNYIKTLIEQWDIVNNAATNTTNSNSTNNGGEEADSDDNQSLESFFKNI